MRGKVYILSFLFFVSCNALDVHPYDCDIKGERDINARNVRGIKRNAIIIL